jgi:hypothetical protein
MSATKHYYRLHDRELTLHLTRQQLVALQSKIYKVLAKSKRGHREYHVSVFYRAHHWRKLSITSHAAHKRRCAEVAATGKWCTD